MTKQPFRIASAGVAMTLVLSVFAVLSIGCGAIDANAFLGLETCDILNCDGLFFRSLADDHDNMAGMDDADSHDDEGDDHMDGVDDHDDDGDDDHMDDMGDHDNGDDDDMDGHDDDDAEEEGHDDAAEGDDGSAPA